MHVKALSPAAWWAVGSALVGGFILSPIILSVYAGEPSIVVVLKCAVSVVSLSLGTLLGSRLRPVAGSPPKLKHAALSLPPVLPILALAWLDADLAGEAVLLYIGGCMLGIYRKHNTSFRLLSMGYRILVVVIGVGMPLTSAAVMAWIAKLSVLRH